MKLISKHEPDDCDFIIELVNVPVVIWEDFWEIWRCRKKDGGIRNLLYLLELQHIILRLSCPNVGELSCPSCQ
jgi:hypothetical protein